MGKFFHHLRLFLLLSFFFLCSCERIFFFPMKEMVFDPASIGIRYNAHKIPVSENENVYAWELLPEGEEKGSVLHFHGNAENISTHVGSVAWMTASGYRVYLIDYRGFGASDGKASVRNAIDDIRKTIEWFSDKKELRPSTSVASILFAQSIGASLSLYALSEEKYRSAFDGLIFESPFYSYRRIAREKIQDTIILYPFAWPLSFLFTGCCSPLEGARMIDDSSIRMIVIEDDKIVPPEHTKELFEAIPAQNKSLWSLVEGGHNSFMVSAENKKKVLEFIESLQPK